MAIGDFMHKQLVSAAGRDALTSIGAGAGIGAAGGAASALVTGNDTMIGGAMSGGMLGAIGGTAARYAGTRYGANYAAKVAADPSANKGLDLTMFSKKENVDPFDFMSNSDSNNAALKALQETPMAQKGAGTANAAENAPAGTVNTSPMGPPKPTINQQARELVEEGISPNIVDATKALRGQYKPPESVRKALDNADEYSRYQKSLGGAEAANPSVSGQAKMTSSEMDAIEANQSNAAARSAFDPNRATGPVNVQPGWNALSGGGSAGNPHVTPMGGGFRKNAITSGIQRSINNPFTPSAHKFDKGLSKNSLSIPPVTGLKVPEDPNAGYAQQISVKGPVGPVAAPSSPLLGSAQQPTTPFAKNALASSMGF